MAKRSKAILIRVSPAELDGLKMEAERRDLPVSTLVRHTLKDALEKQEKREPRTAA